MVLEELGAVQGSPDCLQPLNVFRLQGTDGKRLLNQDGSSIIILTIACGNSSVKSLKEL